MKKIIKYLGTAIAIAFLTVLAIALLSSCKKSTVQPNPTPQPTPVYSYTASVILSNDTTVAYGDTLIIKVNEKVIINKGHRQIPSSIENIQLKTGDKLYIRYNPGNIYWPHYDSVKMQWIDYITAQNDLVMSITSCVFEYQDEIEA